MKFIFLFCFIYLMSSKLILAQENSKIQSFAKDGKTMLTAAAETLKKGIEKVPVLNAVVFGDCVNAPNICPNENITFWYYSRSTPDETRILELERSGFNLPRSQNPWKVLIHGYTKSKDEIPNPELRSAYFKRGDYNIISVDYAPLARNNCYAQSVQNVPLIAKCTAQFLDKLMDDGYFTPNNLHVIGFSLGAQIAGQIHKYLRHEKPYRVTGLDPASPLFDGVINDKLNSGAGKFVDVIHTNAFFKGDSEASGHADFYLNGGSIQPGCLTGRNESFSVCNHDRSPIYFAESINSEQGFWGVPCESYKKYLSGGCTLGEEMLVRMGEDVPLTARGKYFLKTTSKPPFALGKKIYPDIINNKNH